MPNIAINSTTSYTLSESEELAGMLLTPSNLMLMQNRLASAVEQKLALKVDTTNITEFIQNEAFLAGQIDLLHLIIEEANNASIAVNTQ